MAVHALRRALRAALADGRRVVGTFVKVPMPDVIEICAGAGFDFVVVDLEHSTLGEADAIALVRHADVCGLAALVRVPAVDAPLVNRLLENGAAGIQLSMLQRAEQTAALVAATRYAPAGRRSLSLAHRTAVLSGLALPAYLAAERDDPPLLVGQVETASTEPLAQLLPGLDVCFIGSTDLSVDLGVASGDPRLRDAVAAVRSGASAAGVTFGGWAPSADAAGDLGLGDAGYLVVGSDLQLLAAALRSAAPAPPKGNT